MNRVAAPPEASFGPRLARWLQTGSALAAAAVAAIGAVVLIGWWLDLAALKSLQPQWVSMKPNTALGFLLSGLALACLLSGPAGGPARRLGQACAGAVALLGLLTLAEYLGGWDLGIDNRLFAEPASALQTSSPGRMAPATALNFLLSGLALLLLDTAPWRRLQLAQLLIVPPLAVSFLAVIGYLYEAETLYRVGPFSSMALHTALAFAALGGGVLGARPERSWVGLLTSDTVGGVIVRRLTPVVLLVIPLVFWLRLMGERAGYFGIEFGIALMVLINILILNGVFWWSATSLNRTEAERRQTEAQLRKLSQAIEQSPENVIITNLKGEIEYVNEAFLRNTGYLRREVIGQNPRFLQSSKTPPETYRALWEALDQGRIWSGELINKRKDGSEYVDSCIISPLYQPDGSISHYVGVQEDITEKKRLGDELDRHRRHLEELVAERTAQLEAARVAAEDASRAKGDFLAHMSHEIRTPLNAVLGFARIGARDSAGRASQENFGRIQDAGQHLLGVINDILDFSKIEAGKFTLDSQPFQLAAVIANARSFMISAARQKGLAYEMEQAPDLPPWVQGDPLRLQQILANLLSNAVKFTSRGAVHLRVTREAQKVCFEVIDTGIGITPEQATGLFMPFAQADSSITRQYGGTGLGLVISLNLAQLMGGEITMDSTPGKGSRFSLRVPLPTTAPAVVEAAAWPPAPSERRLAGIRVLAAEDAEVNRLILEDLLTHEGAQVRFAGNGHEALELLAAHGVESFDVVLMDVQMPVMDGYEAATRIGALAPSLPVIGLTAHALVEERGRSAAAGMVEHITKPIEVDRLVAAILRHARQPPPLAGRRADPATASASRPTPGTGAGLIDWPALLQRFNGRQNFVKRLTATVRVSHADSVAKLQAAVEGGDMESVNFIAHGLKTLGDNLAADRLHALARETESAAREGREEALPLAGELADVLACLLDELAAERNETGESR